MSSSKELKLFIDAIDSGVARMMLLDGAVFEFPAALLPEGARGGEIVKTEVVPRIDRRRHRTYARVVLRTCTAPHEAVRSALDGTVHHGRRLVEVDVPAFHRKAQHSEAQCRHVYPRASHGAVSHLRIIVEDVFCLLFLHRSILGFLRNGFRSLYDSYGCGKKPTFDKIPSFHILNVLPYLSKPISHAGLLRTNKSMSL